MRQQQQLQRSTFLPVHIPLHQTVALTDATPNSAIYYTTDGSTPSVSSTVYTTPITVNSSITIKAIAIAAGYNQSAVASAAYVITLQPPTPSLTSLSPQFTNAGSAQFNLTVNGSGFTSASSVYWGSAALTTQFVSATQLTATVPAGRSHSRRSRPGHSTDTFCQRHVQFTSI